MGQLVRMPTPLWTAALLLVVAAASAPSAEAVVPGPAAADTTIPARPGDRLVVQNLSGRLVVEPSGGDRVELRGGAGSATDARLVRRGSRLEVEPPERRGRERVVDVRVRIPQWMDVVVQGRDLEVEVRRVGGAVTIQNVEGDVWLEATSGPASVQSVDGSVTVREARGDLRLSSRGDDILVDGVVAGRVRAESGDGDVVLRRVEADEVTAETLDGDVLLDGVFRAGGTYRVATHDGDATVLLPEGAGVRASVSTFDGEFFSDFPVTVERYEGGRTFDFTLGDGRARLEIQVFDGEIRLGRRAGDGGPR